MQLKNIRPENIELGQDKTRQDNGLTIVKWAIISYPIANYSTNKSVSQHSNLFISYLSIPLHEALPVLLAVLHHVDHQGEGKDQGLKALAKGAEPVWHDEETPKDPTNTALLLADVEAAIGLWSIVVDNVDVNSDQRKQGVPQHTANLLPTKQRVYDDSSSQQILWHL